MFESTQINKSGSATQNNAESSGHTVQRKTEPGSLSGIITSAVSQRSIQHKLYVSKKDDKYEREADRASEQIMSPSSSVNSPSIQKKEEGSPVQLKMESGEKEDEKLQKKSETGMPEKKQEMVQGKNADAAGVPNDLKQNLDLQKGNGAPLFQDTKVFMEKGFHHDFGNVKIHTGSKSVEMNKQLKSQAFTYGSDIYFNEGKYKPDTKEGTHLLAHELTHVIQQGKAKSKKSVVNKQTENISNKTALSSGGESTSGGTFDSAAPAVENRPASEKPQGGNAPGKIKTEVTAKKHESEKAKVSLHKAKQGFSSGGGGGGVKVEAPKALPMSGASDQIVENFTNANASQIAATYPSLGNTVEKKLGEEQNAAAENTPSLKAEIGGVKKVKTTKAKVPQKNSAEISKGVTSPEPSKPKVEPQKNLAPPPDNKRVDDQLEKKESGGFFSWFKSQFSGFMSAISTNDPGLNTSAGQSPKMNLSGEADPGRAGNQRNQSDTEINKGNAETVSAIQSNPGKENIQPVRVDETKKPEISKETKIKIETQQDKGMQDYLDLKYPADARSAADKKMAPVLEKGLSKQRDAVAASASKKDKDKQDAITKAQSENEKLNKEAGKHQDEIVGKSRDEVTAHQKAGLKEAQDKLKEFNKEADTEQSGNLKQIQDRATKDQSEANDKIAKGEKDAKAEKKKGEEEARRKKEQLKKESEHQSWWDRAVSAVKSAVKAITKAIDAVFDAVRKAVKFIIDKAKEAALAVIEAGRRWIIDKLNKFGNWLKSQVNKYLSAFPALARRINAAIDSAVNKAKAAVNFIANKLKAGVEYLANKLANAIDSILSKFQAALKAAIQVAGALLTGDFAGALKIAFLAACELTGIDPNPILNFLNYAGNTIKIIFKDPISFIMNVARGVKKGLDQFVAHIKKHLINGLIGWLTGEISKAGITLPEKFDLKGIFSLVMQILGLTYQNIRAKVVKKLGPNGEEIVSRIESTVEFVKDLVTRGPIAIWDRVKESLSSLKETVMSGIRDWVITTVIKEGVLWLISLLNPASAIARALKMLYDLVMFLVNRYQQIVAFVKSVFESVGALARGSIGQAANAVEDALARSIPVIISFLASLLGIGGISKTIRNIITKIRAPIDKALDKVIGWIVDKGKALFAMGKSLFAKGKEKLFGKKKEEPKKENELTAENNKKAAIREVRRVLAHGIRKKSLIRMLGELEKEYHLKSATLNSGDDVVIYNSEPVTVKGKEEDVPLALAPEKGSKSLKKDTSGKIKLGSFSPSYTVHPTLRGVVQNAVENEDVEYPVNNLPASAARPTSVNATLTGVIKSGLAGNIERDSALTVTVGDLGDIEYALRRGIKSVKKYYHGGHIIASKFGGPESYKNLVPQAIALNVGLYKKMEDFVGDNLRQIDEKGNAVSNINNTVSLSVRLYYGGAIKEDLTRLILLITRKSFGREWKTINNMPNSTAGEKKAKQEEEKKLKGKEKEYYNRVAGGKKNINVEITPWIPTTLNATVKMDSEYPVGAEDTKKYYQEAGHTGTSADMKMIYAQNAKIDEKGKVKSPEQTSSKTEKKKWSASFSFHQSHG